MMGQADFETAISDHESGAGATADMDLVTFFTEFNAALDVRIAANTASSPAALKLRAVLERVLGRQNEANPHGAGLQLRP